MAKFLTTLDRILTPYALSTDQLLIVLQGLLAEVNQRHGFGRHLLPEHPEEKKDLPLSLEDSPYSLQPGNGPRELIHQNLHDRLVKILKWALETLPNQTNADGTLLKSQKALRKIIRRWKQQRTTWDSSSITPSTESFQRILSVRQRTLTVPLNQFHPKALRIFNPQVLLNPQGKIEVTITYGYPRDHSNWTLQSNQPWEPNPQTTQLAEQLRQRPNEDGPQALKRIADAIEAVLVPVHPGIPGKLRSPEHHETLTRENWYRQLTSPSFQSTTTCADGRLITDKGTKTAFGNIKNAPYTRAQEVASMLADLLARPVVTEAELEILAAGLKAARQLTSPNTTLARFQAELNNRPDYRILRQGVQKAKKCNAKILVWIPGKQNGLTRVPWSQVRLNTRTNKITYRNRTSDINVIHQFDVLPKNHTPLLAQKQQD